MKPSIEVNCACGWRWSYDYLYVKNLEDEWVYYFKVEGIKDVN